MRKSREGERVPAGIERDPRAVAPPLDAGKPLPPGVSTHAPPGEGVRRAANAPRPLSAHPSFITSSRNVRRSTLPTGVLGRLSRISIRRGTL